MRIRTGYPSICGPKVGDTFGCESELVGLVDLLFSVESNSLQVVGKGMLVVSSLTTPVVLCRLVLCFPSHDGSLSSMIVMGRLLLTAFDADEYHDERHEERARD
jgi:hypothetical protein